MGGRSNGTIVICCEGPGDGPGMPEMLVRTPATQSAGLWNNLFLVNDGRFYVGSHVFCVSNIIREAQEDWPIGTIRHGYRIKIDAPRSTQLIVTPDSKLVLRRQSWRVPPYNTEQGTLARHLHRVKSASPGCLTDGQFIGVMSHYLPRELGTNTF